MRQIGQRKVKNATSKSSLPTPTSESEANLIRHRASDSDSEDGSHSDAAKESESNPESDAGHGIPLKEIKGAGWTIACCCDIFCDVNKAVDMVILSKQEEQRESDSKDEDGRHARKEVLDRL
jgi:hypothetical protein